MQTTVLSDRMHSWDTEEHLAQGAKFRHGQPILKKHVFNDTVDLHLLAFSNCFYLPLRLKLITPLWRCTFIPVKQDREEVKSRGSLLLL